MQKKSILQLVAGALSLAAAVSAILTAYLLRQHGSDGIVSVIASLVALLLLALIALVVSRRLTRPFTEMRRIIRRFAEGDMSARVEASEIREPHDVGAALNDMAARLERMIRERDLRLSEQQAALSSMIEGVLAVDRKERVLSLNGAAARLFGVSAEQARGRSIQEVVRNTTLHKLIGRVLLSGEPAEDDIVLTAGTERFLQARGTLLRDPAGERLGVLVVLNDVTRLKRLENMRRDFVANVSHELKTPITSIKGAVETLQDGAIENREDAARFLGILSRQADRLNAIIEDLLNLARVEQEAEQGAIPMTMESIPAVLHEAIRACRTAAEAKRITLALDCTDELNIRINAALIEQAVINLIDNAIKYSDEGRRVVVSAARSGDEVSIAVQDEGWGIGAEHLPRLFERFYRVDTSRSRQLGGTGLGLAIVKHIVQAHCGRVDVTSTPGKGSRFSIYLPAAGNGFPATTNTPATPAASKT